mmetsp:Transcript_117771/g.380047  ORF Transcript_117771/g.380047 Transcript_117771/m.380047 type:complete len:225 (-) Transcript_117771:1367-2041(-)
MYCHNMAPVAVKDLRAAGSCADGRQSKLRAARAGIRHALTLAATAAPARARAGAVPAPSPQEQGSRWRPRALGRILWPEPPAAAATPGTGGPRLIGPSYPAARLGRTWCGGRHRLPRFQDEEPRGARGIQALVRHGLGPVEGLRRRDAPGRGVRDAEARAAGGVHDLPHVLLAAGLGRRLGACARAPVCEGDAHAACGVHLLPHAQRPRAAKGADDGLQAGGLP